MIMRDMRAHSSNTFTYAIKLISSAFTVRIACTTSFPKQQIRSDQPCDVFILQDHTILILVIKMATTIASSKIYHNIEIYNTCSERIIMDIYSYDFIINPPKEIIHQAAIESALQFRTNSQTVLINIKQDNFELCDLIVKTNKVNIEFENYHGHCGNGYRVSLILTINGWYLLTRYLWNIKK